MSRRWSGADANGPLLGVAIVGMIVTFGAGWALGGATGAGADASGEAGAGRTLAAVAGTPSPAGTGTGVPTGLPGASASTDLPTDLPTGELGVGDDIAAAATGPAGQSASGALPVPTKAARPPFRAFTCPTATVRVRTAAELTAALSTARPGASIALAPGVYQGEFVATRSGTPKRPVYLCGGRGAVLDAGAVKGGYALHLNGASWWRVKGFTVQNAQKGVMLDGVTGVGLQDLAVDRIGDEAVHLRRNSTRSVVRGLTIGVTGLRKPKFGEGVYIGTAKSNWCKITGCAQDHSDGNFVLDNVFTGTSSEAVDIKEGTNGGVVAGNRFDGSRITGADSWVDVKGNGWLITGNRGVRSPMDGFQVHEIVDGYGYRNMFSRNISDVDGPGYAINVTKTRSGNVVTCDNRVSDAGQGLSNVPCTR